MAEAGDAGEDRNESAGTRTWMVVVAAAAVSAAATSGLWLLSGAGGVDDAAAVPATELRDEPDRSEEVVGTDHAVVETAPLESAPVESAPVGSIPVSETLGVYPGYGDSESLRDFERSLGTELGAVVQFADRTSADEMVFSVQGAVADLQEWLDEREPIYSLTIPLGFGDADARSDDGRALIRQNLAETAAGAHDAQYRLVADRLIAAGVEDAVLRLGHEFDGDWFPWSSRGSCEAYIDAFRHVADLLRQESEGFRFEWTASLRNFDEFGSCAYPGDDVVDIIGFDVYDRGGPGGWADGDGWLDPVAVWTEQFLPPMQSLLAFAIDHAKPVSYPEWGLYLDTESGPAGGDNPHFVDAMADWFDSLPEHGGGSLAYQAYFMAVDVHDIRTAPDSWSAFQRRFGA